VKALEEELREVKERLAAETGKRLSAEARLPIEGRRCTGDAGHVRIDMRTERVMSFLFCSGEC
jgi:hypothetical protein